MSVCDICYLICVGIYCHQILYSSNVAVLWHTKLIHYSYYHCGLFWFTEETRSYTTCSNKNGQHYPLC